MTLSTCTLFAVFWEGSRTSQDQASTGLFLEVLGKRGVDLAQKDQSMVISGPGPTGA